MQNRHTGIPDQTEEEDYGRNTKEHDNHQADNRSWYRVHSNRRNEGDQQTVCTKSAEAEEWRKPIAFLVLVWPTREQ